MNLAHDPQKSRREGSAHSPDLLYAGFNQEGRFFAVGLESGFRVYACDPLKEVLHKEFDDGGIGIAEMMYSTNYLALVGGGSNPKYPPNKVVLWDDARGNPTIELEFRSENEWQSVNDRIVVALRSKVFVYTLANTPKLLYVFETCDNERGLLALSTDDDVAMLAFPARRRGYIQMVDLRTYIASPVASPMFPTTSGESGGGGAMSGSGSSSSNNSPLAWTPSSGQRIANTSFITAHSSDLSCLAISPRGKKVASASEKGTLIRVFDGLTGQLLNELRRGVDRADIHSIAFNPLENRVCVSSDKGTIHIFNLERTTQSEDLGPYYGDMSQRPSSTKTGNKHSSLVFMKDMLPKYFSSEWSFASFHVNGDVRCLCTFGSDQSSVFVLCSDGSLYKFSFDLRTGKSTQDWYRIFLK